MAAGLEGDASQPTNKQAVQCQSLNQATQKIFKLKEPNVAIHAPIKAENFYRLILGENTHATDWAAVKSIKSGKEIEAKGWKCGKMDTWAGDMEEQWATTS